VTSQIARALKMRNSGAYLVGTVLVNLVAIEVDDDDTWMPVAVSKKPLASMSKASRSPILALVLAGMM